MPDPKPDDGAGETTCHHGWRGSAVKGVIRDRCPACQGQVFVGEGGALTCANLRCMEPDTWKAWNDRLAALQREVEAKDAEIAPIYQSVCDMETEAYGEGGVTLIPRTKVLRLLDRARRALGREDTE